MDLSLVIPVKEESENLPELMKEIWAAIEPTGMEFEVIVIDDGSRDNTWEVVEGLAKEYSAKPGSSVNAFRFQFNCGKAAALALGFSKARGKYVATLDGDLQDDPLEIPKMIKILESGYDLVSGWKIRRLDPWHKTLPSKLFNFLPQFRGPLYPALRRLPPLYPSDGQVAGLPHYRNAGGAPRSRPWRFQIRRFPLGERISRPCFADVHA